MLQRSPEWYDIRCGKVTASRIADIMADPDGKKGLIGRRNYCAEKVLERKSGVPYESSYVSAAMQAGIDNEAAARDAYAFRRGIDIVEEGFVVHPKIPRAGASPDGLVGDDGLVEIKCPEAYGMLQALKGKEPDLKYLLQCQFQLACMPERKWVDLCNYNHRDGDLVIQRIMRDDTRIHEIEEEVLKFLREVDREFQLMWDAVERGPGQ